VDTTKKFFKYLIAFIIVFGAVSFLTSILMDWSYEPVKKGAVAEKYFKIDNLDCKATNVNGYVEGKVENTTNSYVDYLRIIIELYNENNIKMGEEYYEFVDFRAGETRNFRVDYKYEGIKEYNIKWSREKLQVNTLEFPSFQNGIEVNGLDGNLQPTKINMDGIALQLSVGIGLFVAILAIL